MKAPDVVVIGAGHNGLVAADRLTREGFAVKVCEARSHVGGLSSTRPLFAGHRVDVGERLASTSLVRRLDGERLRRFGLEWEESPALVLGASAAGRCSFELSSAPEAGTGAREARFRGRLREQLGKLRRLFEAPVGLAELGRLATDSTLVRWLSSPVAELVSGRGLDPALETLLCALALPGCGHGPRANGTGFNLLYQLLARGFGPDDACVRFSGGAGALCEALERAITAGGGEVLKGAPVESVRIRSGRAVGVKLLSGEEIDAAVVISTLDPTTTFLRLVGAPHLEPRFLRQLRAVRTTGSAARLALSLDELPPPLADALAGRAASLLLASDVDELERGADAVKWGRLPVPPPIELSVPTLADASLTPDGRQLVLATVHQVPWEVTGGWEVASRDLGRSIVDRIEASFGELGGRVREEELLTPRNWAADYGATKGCVHHVELSLSRAFRLRPFPLATRDASVKGLILGGAGAHPGGGLTGWAGELAARAAARVLQDDS